MEHPADGRKPPGLHLAHTTAARSGCGLAEGRAYRRGVWHLTHLARVVDLRRRSNLVAVAALLGFGLAGYLLAEPGETPWRAALSAGWSAFLAWALARELDPDRPVAAEVTAVAAGVAAVTVGGNAGVVLAVMLCARILLRSSGLPPTIWDALAVSTVAAAVAGSPEGWAAGMAVAVALAFDASFPDDATPRVQLAVAAMAAVAVTVVATVTDAMEGPWRPPGPVAATIAGLGLLAGITLPSEVPSSVGDYTRLRLSPARLRLARRAVLATLAVAVLVGGGPGAVATAPAWVAVVVVAVVRRVSGFRV